KHPKTLAFNIKAIVEFGYFKDFSEILYRILEGPESRKIQRMEWQDKKRGRKRPSKKIKNRGKFKQESNEKVEALKKEIEGVLENVEEMSRGIEKEKARALRKEREKAKAKKAFDKYNSDSNYRLLFDCVAEFFANFLKSDIKKLNDGKFFDITLAAKWCPSIDSSYDKATLICEAIARRVFPRKSEKEFEGLEEAHYVYRVRDSLRKQVLVLMHKALELSKVYMSANKWNSLHYNRVPSIAMKTYKELFKKHDKEMFREMVEDVGKKRKLTNCIAVCDVSGSMFGIPMDVAVALELLVSELSEEPWKGKVVTFSANP
ncbi:hypothetical protein Gotur_019000, partial [Gossypium turneri]